MSIRNNWLFSLLGLAVASPALADSPARPHSHKQVAPGGKFVFVMIVSESVEDEVRPWNEETAAAIREVRRTYRQSGMYRNDESVDPLWTVDWYAHRVELTSDGIHLIRLGPWAWLREDKTPDLDCEAVSFFASGRMLRTYRVSELVSHPGRLKRTVSHYFWQEEGRLSGEFEYTITTLDGNSFVFDVRMGEIINESKALRVGSGWGWWAALGTLIAAVVIGFVVLKSRQRSIGGRGSTA